MKFYLATGLLAALCALTFAQDEDMMSELMAPMKLVNEKRTVGGRPGNRIIGGRDALLGQIPYQASLLIEKDGGTYLCGGALIASNWIVTAAHCAQGAVSFRIRLGSTSYSQNGQDFYSTRGHVHHNYNSSNLNDDIALIRLPGFAVYTRDVHPIEIADIGLTFSSVRVSGWGTMSNGQVSNTLKYADLQNLDIVQCARTYGSDIITENTVCTVSNIGESPCSGDSGGPLVDNISKHLVGVVSFVSSEGCTSGTPAGYVRVAAYRSWIRKITKIHYL